MTNRPQDGNTKRRTKGKVKKSENLSKDEETIQKLKVYTISRKLSPVVLTTLTQSFVVACGVRRIWSKVFEGLDTPAQQIKKLKEILHELGMTGRLSLEKARAIREKREFAQELRKDSTFLCDIFSLIPCFRGCSRVPKGNYEIWTQAPCDSDER